MNDSSTYGDAPMQPGTESGVLPGEADKGTTSVTQGYGQGLPPAGGWKRDMPEPTVEHTHGPFAGPYSSCPACSAAMTYAQRQQLRHLIDQAKRRQLANHKPPPGRNQAARRATYRAYYERNRARILARRAASRAAA